MSQLKRDEIHLISKHSNWSETSVQKALDNNVYHTSEAWQKFLKLLIISLGIGFATAGIIFFFAYNWNDLHKFVKIGMVEALLVSATLLVLFSKFSLQIKNILLTGAAVLVGVLFAVFGQIYQTGANAYDFFLGWTLAITLWVIISNFTPLWLVFLILINTTFVLYTEQVVQGWSELFVSFLLTLLNVVFLIVSLFLNHYKKDNSIPNWFTNIIALVIVFIGTFGTTIGMFEPLNQVFWGNFVFVLMLFGTGLFYGFKNKSSFYLAIISFGSIFIGSGFLIKISADAAMFFVVSLFVITSVTLVIKMLIDLQKKWSHD